MATGARQVVVIGAGVSGLTSAILLAEAGWPVRVFADAMPHETTSAVAGAVWAPPRPLGGTGDRAAVTLGWTDQSLGVFRELAKDPATGVRLTPAVAVGEFTETEVASAAAALIPDLQAADPADIPEGFAVGFRATMPMIDMPEYLGYLTRRLTAAGCRVEARSVRSLAEVADTASIVVNCTGLGAAALTGDDTLRPLFGQHVVLTNPGLHQLFIELSHGPEWTCIFPHPRRVVCGGISIRDRWDSTPEPDVTARILERCRRIEPRLGEAEVIETITGLRPDRPSVRLEAEPLGHAPGRAVCIHNYGHGRNGVTLSWGCARDVLRLVKDIDP
ncbi:FAD-dependent oxidoreductase [Mycobacterium sp.]|uniref:FAD-dependent oxidoreductase n=1 Tax=Mycobacterium sp. TaxID=1785 RepID=UPI0025E6D70A|nr:FAD-dependent oxidoreductase [Mycobacterium sp.]MBW0015258.1 FAD-binding oxidoreductase [Mycobacterium sp.]